MVSADAIRATVQRYVKLMNDGDADGIAALYAEDATIEDPIGTEPRRGRENLRAFYRLSAGKVRLSLTGPVRACAGEAAFPMRGEIGPEGSASVIDIIDVMRFDADGRITSMRAFWSPDDLRKA